MKYLYGRNGSKYKLVEYIPQANDSWANAYFNQNGNHYYNKDGHTYQMVERGRDTWANKRGSSRER